MAIDIVKITLKYTMILALIGLVLTWAFGLSNNLVETIEINGSTMYQFNWFKYSGNIQNIWTTSALNFNDIIPPTQWDSTANIGAVVNNIAVVFNWLYFPINFVLYIIRWVGWILRLFLGLIGWDFSMTNGEYNSILIKILTWITQNLMIPYIQP